jgi:hypothetical protein
MRDVVIDLVIIKVSALAHDIAHASDAPAGLALI